jgi:nucleoside-diphosphate-sugar epimerase
VILVTGAAGLVGKELTKLFDELGISYMGLSHNSFDLANEVKLVDWMDEAPSQIIHLAAAVPQGFGREDNGDNADETRRMDENVARAAKAWGCRVIYASTCLLYDSRDPAVKFENSPVRAREGSPYSSAKLEGEKTFASLGSSLVFRLSAPVGPSMVPTLVLPKFVAAAKSDVPLEVWGSGFREQDFVDLSDIANFLVIAAGTKALPNVLNLVSSKFVCMMELAELVVRTIGGGRVEGPIESVHDPLDAEFARYSNLLALEALGWKPLRPLSSSIAEIGAHYAKNY